MINSETVFGMITSIAIASNTFFLWRNNVLTSRTAEKVDTVHDCVNALHTRADAVLQVDPPRAAGRDQATRSPDEFNIPRSITHPSGQGGPLT